MTTNLAQTLKGCRSWADLQRRWRPLTKKQKGDLFEQLIKHYLLLEPEYASKLKSVWLLGEVPSGLAKRLKLPSNDQGIDLVAETKEGEYWAIQSKYREESDQSITWREISTFTGLAFGVCRDFSYGLIASTTERITNVLKHQDRIGFAALDVWQGLDEEFFKRLQQHLYHKREVLKARLPRPHQNQAIVDAFTYFVKKKHKRGKLIMPCGTGKSLTSYFIAQKLKAQKIVIAVPSLSLIKQTLKAWMYESMARKQNVEWICVCSDESAGKVEQDDAVVLKQDLGVPCLTNSKEIAEWLKRKHNSLTIVFTTYQSGEALAKAARKAGFTFDLGIMDEAHKTAGSKGRVFSHLVLDKNIKIDRRLFMTATERRYRGESDAILSMEDLDEYGETIHKLSFKKALEYKPPILSDYKIVTIHISQEEVADLVRNRTFVRPKTKGWSKEMEAENLAALIALRKAMNKYPIRHAVSFHGSIKRAQDFQESNDAYSKSFPSSGRLQTFHVSGKTPTGTRAKEIDQFSKAPRSLITNARCLTEGVDVPNIDAVLFADPRKSLVDIVQAVGRALRPSPEKKFGYVIVPVVHDKNSKPGDIFDSDSFKEVLTTLRALGSQDDRIIEYFRAVSQGKPQKHVRPFEGVLSENLAKKIDLKEFVKSVNLRCWDRLAKIAWRPFEEARRFVQPLGLQSHQEWALFCRGLLPAVDKKKPLDIPSSPDHVYKTLGWNGFGDWLGTGVLQTQQRNYLPFGKARMIVVAKNLKNQAEWQKYARSRIFPKEIPADPRKVYGKSGWRNLGHWLGTGNVATREKKYREFTQARSFARSLNLKNLWEWNDFCKGKLKKLRKIPSDIPIAPWASYKEKGWDGLNDWLGTRHKGKRKFRSFKKARSWARSLGLSGQSEWNQLCKGFGKGGVVLPKDIPTNPNINYRGEGWLGYGDWVGTGNISNSKKRILSFTVARKKVRLLKLKNQKEYLRYWNKNQKNRKHQNLPQDPKGKYKKDGWISYADWLGRKTFKKVPYVSARRIVRKLAIKTFKDWSEIRKRIGEGYQGVDPRIPKNPYLFYKSQGWRGWSDWFGPQFLVGPRGKKTFSYPEARKRVRKLKLKSPSDYYQLWDKWPATNPLRKGLPRTPQWAYKNKGWKNWADWFGGTYSSIGRRQFLRYEAAKKVVKKLNILTSSDWKSEKVRNKLPVGVPRHPKLFYLNQGWSGWGDFLGRKD